jgi:hypothetical protein
MRRLQVVRKLSQEQEQAEARARAVGGAGGAGALVMYSGSGAGADSDPQAAMALGAALQEETTSFPAGRTTEINELSQRFREEWWTARR